MAKSGKKNAKNPDENHSAEVDSTGHHFRNLRTDRGLSIHEVSEITRISVVNLNAIENQNFDSLPADTFTRGLITIYSEFLGADTPVLVARFMAERETSRNPGRKTRPKHPRKILAPKTLAEPSHVSSITMAGALLLVIIILFTGFCLYTSWNPFGFLFKETENIQSVMQSVFTGSESTAENEPISDPPLPVQGQTAPEQSETKPAVEPPSDIQQHDTLENSAKATGAAATEQSAANSPAEAARYIARVTFLKETRLTVNVDGQTVADETFSQGSEMNWAAYNSLQLVFAEPESATILLNGKTVEFPASIDGSATFQVPENPGGQP